MNNYVVYILECNDGTLYTGITNNLPKRLETHNKGKGAKYTRGRLPCNIISESFKMSKSNALKLEYKIKQTKKDKKSITLIKG